MKTKKNKKLPTRIARKRVSKGKVKKVLKKKKVFKKIRKNKKTFKRTKLLKKHIKKRIVKRPKKIKIKQEQIDALLKKGQERGFITTSEILNFIPNIENNISELERIYDL